MTNKKNKISTKERMLAFTLSQKFTEADLKEIAGGATTTKVGQSNSGTYNPQTGQMAQDVTADVKADF